MARERSPGIRLLLVSAVAALLCIPLLAVYALVYDRQEQSNVAQASITAGWGGAQIVSGPVLAVPYLRAETQTETVEGRSVTRTTQVRGAVYLSPVKQSVATLLQPEERQKSIYRSVIYRAQLNGTARFELPDELRLEGVTPDRLLLAEAELRFGVSDPRGLQNDAHVSIGASSLPLQPGKGVASSGNAGFYGAVAWDGQPLDVTWSYSLRGSRSVALVPRGGETRWEVSSPWPSPSFGGSFLPSERVIDDKGFTATYEVPNLALGQAIATTVDLGMPQLSDPATGMPFTSVLEPDVSSAMAASIGLVEPVDLYSRVDRSVKYGFLFIGFTFLAFLMFDIVAGARVATAEYLLTGAGLVLFFVLLLAFAEVVGFAAAYALASIAIIGLLTAYSAAVLGSWKRARFIAALLVGLYALIYVLLSLEALSLVIGSVMLFLALAGVMYATRKIDWSSVGRSDDVEPTD